MMFGSMIMRPYRVEVDGMQRDGNEGPNTGMRDPEMVSQKVKQTARAQRHGIQYPSLIS